MKSPIHISKNFKLLFLFTALTFMYSCNDDDPLPQPLPSCVTANSDFSQVYSATLASNIAFLDQTTMDLQTHEYTFSVASNETVCSVGYQGNAVLFANNVPYTIEIYDNTNSTIVYSGNHVFDSVATDYQPITATPLVAGNSYTIRRTVNNYLGNIGNTIGRMVRFDGSNPFPVTQSGMTITASDFYGTGGPVPNFGLPYIDIIFQ